ncbi:hypothetical protein V3C99_002628 [Haemonchus contortus]
MSKLDYCTKHPQHRQLCSMRMNDFIRSCLRSRVRESVRWTVQRKITRKGLSSRGSTSFVAVKAGQLCSTFVVRRSERRSEVDAVVTEAGPFSGTGRSSALKRVYSSMRSENGSSPNREAFLLSAIRTMRGLQGRVGLLKQFSCKAIQTGIRGRCRSNRDRPIFRTWIRMEILKSTRDLGLVRRKIVSGRQFSWKPSAATYPADRRSDRGSGIGSALNKAAVLHLLSTCSGAILKNDTKTSLCFGENFGERAASGDDSGVKRSPKGSDTWKIRFDSWTQVDCARADAVVDIFEMYRCE